MSRLFQHNILTHTNEIFIFEGQQFVQVEYLNSWDESVFWHGRQVKHTIRSSYNGRSLKNANLSISKAAM